MSHPASPTDARPHLVREMSLVGLIATALCAMVGVGINIIPFMVQRSAPGVGASIPLVYVVAAVPATLAALCYAILSSAMPRAGGSYVYATRALNPRIGFLGSFAQWFGLSIGMGVVAYLMVPMLRDLIAVAGWPSFATRLEAGTVRVPLALAAIWLFWWINRVGIRSYERAVVILAAAMIVGPILMTLTGLLHTPEDYQRALEARAAVLPPDAPLPSFSLRAFLGACVILFSSFIGFDAIAQAGGEARHARRDLPRSIVVAMGTVTLYYIVFTASVYKAVPWQHIYRVSLVQDTSAPALLAVLMPPWLGFVILLAVTIAILNSIPSVMLANSRMLYAFSADGIFPAGLARVHPRYHTPHHAITMTAVFASGSVLGCHVAGDFFLGVDILVLSMLLNFTLMALAVLTFPRVNPGLADRVSFVRARGAQIAIGGGAALLLVSLLVIQVVGDLTSATAWYGKSSTTFAVSMLGAALLFERFQRRLRAEGLDPDATIFGDLPPE